MNIRKIESLNSNEDKTILKKLEDLEIKVKNIENKSKKFVSVSWEFLLKLRTDPDIKQPQADKKKSGSGDASQWVRELKDKESIIWTFQDI